MKKSRDGGSLWCGLAHADHVDATWHLQYTGAERTFGYQTLPSAKRNHLAKREAHGREKEHLIGYEPQVGLHRRYAVDLLTDPQIDSAAGDSRS